MIIVVSAITMGLLPLQTMNVALFCITLALTLQGLTGFATGSWRCRRTVLEAAAKGFGASSPKKSPKKKKGKSSLADTLEDKPSLKKTSTNKPFVKSEQDELLQNLAAQASSTCIGRTVQESGTDDPFWELIPSLIHSRFSNVKDSQLERVAGFVRHTLDPNLPPDEPVQPFRPLNELHAYMPGLGPTTPFWDPSELPLCQKLSENYETIRQEYHALIEHHADRFQSVTSMNYESGWQTLVLFYNGHRIPDFPYHLCPVTTKLLESVPLAGRIAGFNRQKPGTGIPWHTDGNNMWLTCQMGLQVSDHAWIKVADDQRSWKPGECLLYDTTFGHETWNGSAEEDRIVLHVDFFNTLRLTPVEVEVMQYIYQIREQFLKAEGVAKVGAQIL